MITLNVYTKLSKNITLPLYVIKFTALRMICIHIYIPHILNFTYLHSSGNAYPSLYVLIGISLELNLTEDNIALC